ncbi:MAG: hypothetical protein ACE15F_17540 [bacterium]
MMKTMLSNKFGQIARAYWQPLVLATLLLLILSQLISWGVSVAELRKVDRLITNTATVNPESTPSAASAPPAQPGGSRAPGGPGGPGEPGNPGGSESQPQPAKNIFKQDQINYQLTAIYLNKAVINGQEVGVGEKVGGKATLQEIGVSTVVLKDDDGSQRTLSMFQGEGGGGPGGGPEGGGRSRRGEGGSRPGMVDRPRSDVELPEALRARGISREQLRSMPPEERRRLIMKLTPNVKVEGVQPIGLKIEPR